MAALPKTIPMATTSTNIDSILQEQRKFECSTQFHQQAHIQGLAEYERIYRESIEDPERFWGGIAEELHWFKKWDRVLEWKSPWAKWFVGGQLNLSYNCLDRHVLTARKNKAAIVWESEPGEVRTLTYQQLHREVQKFANVLKSLGVKKGDRVAIYMGMTPELPIAMLACARIGAPHSVVFGGFSSNALVDRIHDSQATAVITQDGSYRRGSEVKLFPAVEEALKSCPSVKSMSRRAIGLRASALYSLHFRNHWKAEGRSTHHRRVFSIDISHHQVGVRSQGRGHLLVYGGHRMGDGPQLHRVRAFAERGHQPDVRRGAQLS